MTVNKLTTGNNTQIIACPQCKASVKWSVTNPYRPFCSNRCRFIDLNGWVNEEYKICNHPVSASALCDDIKDC